MAEFSSQKQQPLIIAFFAIVLLIAGILYKSYIQPAQESAPQPTSLIAPTAPTPSLPVDLFQDNNFLKLQTYQPVVAPEPTERPNPFAAP